MNRYNDNVYHINYIPTEIQPTDHLTYQIVTWIIFSIVLLILIIIYINCFFTKKNNKINTNEIINEVVVSNNSNHFQLPLQAEPEINNLNKESKGSSNG